MATNKKFRIQNGANIEGELSFNNQTVIDAAGVIVTSSVQPAIEAVVSQQFVNDLQVYAASAVTAESVTTISGFTTTDITEGANLYYTEQRARQAVNGGTGISYDNLSGTITTDLVGGEGVIVAGNQISFDGSAISQDIVPSADVTYSLGSPTHMWKDVYIGPGSLYLNGTKILEDNSGTITMYADAGQNLAFGTTGGGSIDFNAGASTITVKSDLVILNGKTITTTGGAATVFGGDVDLSGNNLCNIAAPSTSSDAVNKAYVDSLVAAAHSGDKTFSNNVIVGGNLTVQGTTTTVNSETISLADNIIDLNSNVVSGTPTENAGIRVMRGDEAAVQIRWNEANDHWETYNGSTFTKIALSTSDLAEGSNLYYTVARVNAVVDPIVARIDGDVQAEADARVAADDNLQAELDAEIAARGAADSDFSAALASEVSSRIAGDSDVLASAKAYADVFKAETDGSIASLQSTDATLAASIATNAANATAGDADTLASAIAHADAGDSDLNAAIATNASAIGQLQVDVSAESTARADADVVLQSGIDAVVASLVSESSAREDGDAANAAAIAVVDGKVDAILGTSPETLNTLQEIVAAFEGADTSLQTLINDNGSRLNTAEADVDALEAQFASLTASLATLNVTVGDNLVSLQGDDAAEQAARIAGDDALQSAIDALVADQVVQNGSITTGDANTLVSAKAYADAGDATLQGNIDTLSGTVSSEIGRVEQIIVDLPIASGDSDTLASAKAYADAGDATLSGQIATLTSNLALQDTSMVERDSDVLASAKGYADAGDSVLNTKIDTVEASLLTEISNGDSDLNSAIAAEAAARSAADSDLQSQINFITSNTDAAALDSLTEIVAAFQNADSTLTGVISSNTSNINVLQSDVLALQSIDAGNRLTILEADTSANDLRLIDIEGWTTDNLPEGSVNKYFTEQRVRDTLVGGLCITFDSLTGEIAIDEAEVLAALNVKNSTELGGQAPSYYRINIYNVAGQLVN